MESSDKFLHLTYRFSRAVDYARQVHVSYRKGSHVPYMAHLLGVAALVLGECGHVPFTVTEDLVVSALARRGQRTRVDCPGCTTPGPKLRQGGRRSCRRLLGHRSQEDK